MITEAGRKLLSITKEGIFESNNIFDISKDSYVYLKQLLKTSNNISGKVVRPFIVLIKILLELGYLTYEEFMYFIPLIVDLESYKLIIKK